jgi:4'-phosphopantetheinyl transferase
MPVIHCHDIDPVAWSIEQPGHSVPKRAIDVWRVAARSDKNLLNLLSDAEKAQSDRFYKKEDASRFITGRFALRLILAGYAGMPPGEIQILAGAGKKPLLANDHDIHFNLAHSGDWILIAVSGTAVGVDLELVNPAFSFDGILENNFSKEEINFIRGAENPRAAFYFLWTRKEALIKATGRGLHDNLQSITVLDGSREIDQRLLVSSNGWNINSFAVLENYQGAVSFDEKIRSINFRELETSLFLQAI